MKKILSIIILSITLFSCKKKVIEGTYTIKGHIYNDCSKTPLKNYLISLRNHYYENNRPKYVTCDTTYTDNNGYFEFTFTNPTSGLLYITGSNGIYPGFINDLPIANIDSLKIMFEARSSLNATLSTNESYSSKDTLYITGSGSSINTKIVGPFKSGQILPTFNYSFSANTYKDNFINSILSYKINVKGIYKTITKNVYPCTNDTVTINLN